MRDRVHEAPEAKRGTARLRSAAGTLPPRLVPAATAPAAAPAAGLPGRDHRIDLFRGLALAMIFVNHVPGTVYEHFTSRNFGFSDAAEGFVLLSGISAALAYGRGLQARPLWPGVRRIWGRAWTLYLVHVVMSVWVLWIVAATLRWGQVPDPLARDNFQYLVRDPLGVFLGLPMLTHQFGYVNILPLYAVLLLGAPVLLLAGLRWPLRTLAASAALWAVAGLSRVNLPNTVTEGGWFFNPLSWQLLFTVGLLTGLALRQGRRLVPVKPWLVALAAGFLLLSLVWLTVPTVGRTANAWMGWIASQGAPRLVRDFDKDVLALPRLLHVLALAYVISVIPGLRRLAGTRWFWPLTVLGRHALPVFVLGTLLAYCARSAKEIAFIPSLALDSVLIGAGLALLLGFAALLDFATRDRRSRA